MLEFPASSFLFFFFLLVMILTDCFLGFFFLFSFSLPDYKNEAGWELLVVSELNGRADIDTSEGGWLDLPVLDRVTEKTHSGVRSLLSVVARWAEVI